MAASTSDVVLLIGRILLGWIFVRSGYGKIFDIPAYAATFPPLGAGNPRGA
jgi:putative oxidoreductase